MSKIYLTDESGDVLPYGQDGDRQPLSSFIFTLVLVPALFTIFVGKKA